MNNSVRNATKKLNTYKSKHPGVVDEKHEELRRNVIIANLSVARHEEKMKKVEERTYSTPPRTMSSLTNPTR